MLCRFKGVDEVAWIKVLSLQKLMDLKKPLIVFRQIETKAAYAVGKQDAAQALAEKLAKLGNVRFIQRYNGQGKTFGAKEGFVDSASLVANADLVVSYGGTIAREAALQGVPSIAISDMAKTYVNTYLTKKGFPLFATTEQGVIGYAKKYLGKRFDVQSELAELENPVDAIAKIVNNFKKTVTTIFSPAFTWNFSAALPRFRAISKKPWLPIRASGSLGFASRVGFAKRRVSAKCLDNSTLIFSD